MNKFIGIGRFTKDIEIKQTQTGKKVCNFSLAFSRRFGDGTDFLDFEAWEGTAEFLNKYFKKGDLVGIVGRIESRKWEKDGHTYTQIITIVEEVSFCGKREKQEETANDFNSQIPDFLN